MPDLKLIYFLQHMRFGQTSVLMLIYSEVKKNKEKLYFWSKATKETIPKKFLETIFVFKIVLALGNTVLFTYRLKTYDHYTDRQN